MPRREPALSGKVFISARIDKNYQSDRWYWWIVFEDSELDSEGDYATPLACARALKDELMKHCREF